MAMPWANVCSTVDCVRGDGSFTFHLLGLFHFHRHWALGLGGHFALWPTAQPTLSDQARAADRELSRDYYAITLELRYFPWRQTVGAPAPKTLHPYVGADLGFALLSDRYHSPPLDQSGAVRIGEPGFLLRNQGALARVVVGTDLGLSQHWALGLTLRSGAIWFAGPKSTTFGDQSTLSGWNFSLAATLSIKAYLNL
jgi:hypothetical protein